MKKILLSFGLCLAVTAGYAQSKEAKKEIRKYYTEKQIKYIQNRLNENISDCKSLIYITNSLSSNYFSNSKHELAYYEYFLLPLETNYCTKVNILLSIII
ncbi:hypothetical protein RAO12_05835 [Ornithobacterium rhinotracheale]|uniref:hypothetical protein n=1 Tax=Ornithobacterium rhinotracheale TaxID=28251 RepID=UPI003872AC9A